MLVSVEEVQHAVAANFEGPTDWRKRIVAMQTQHIRDIQADMMAQAILRPLWEAITDAFSYQDAHVDLVPTIHFTTGRDAIESAFPFVRDERLVMSPDAPEPERAAALDRLVSLVLPWRLDPNKAREQRALGELRSRADGRSLTAVQTEVLRAAIPLVLASRSEPQRIKWRVGDQWGYLASAEDGASSFRPAELPYPPDKWGYAPEGCYHKWFRREVGKAALAHLLDEPYPARSGTKQPPRLESLTDDATALLEDAQPGPLGTLLEQERSTALLSLLATASPQQQQLLDLKAQGLTTAEAGRRLGISASAARVQMLRLRQKAEKVLAEKM